MDRHQREDDGVHQRRGEERSLDAAGPGHDDQRRIGPPVRRSDITSWAV